MVRDARLFNASRAGGLARILGGSFDHSAIVGETVVGGFPTVKNSILDCHTISGRPTITNSRILDLVEIWDTPVIEGIIARDAVAIYGTARCVGPWTVGGRARIHEGTWTRPPRTLDLEFCYLTECRDDRILIDCRCRPRNWWIEHGHAYGHKNGWPAPFLEQAMRAILNWENLS